MRHLRELLLLLPLGACYAFIGLRNPELALQIPLFLAFFAAFVAVPALGLGGLLVRLPLSLPERLALGAPAALAMLFGLAWTCAALGLPQLVWLQPAIGLAACLAGLTALRSRSTASPQTPVQPCPPTPWGDLLLMLVVLSAALALFLPKLSAVSVPSPGLSLDYYMDDVASSACVFAALRAMEHGLPVLQPYLAGTRLVYHLLYHFDYAACTLTTGIHPLDQVLFLWPPVLWLLMATAVVTGCRRLAGFGLLESAIAAMLLLFTGGYGFYATPAVQLFGYQHTFFMGLPALTLFACALYGHLSGRGPRLYATHAALCFLVAAATKATLLLLLPLSLLPVLVLRILRRQARLPEFLLAGQVLAVVVLLRLVLYVNTARVALRVPSPGKLLLGSLGNLGEMAVVLGVYVFLALAAVEANTVLRHKCARARQYHLFCLGFVVISAVLLKLFNFVGGDFYFYWHARVLVLLAVAPVLAHLIAWRTPRFALAAALLLALGTAAMLQSLLWPTLFHAERNWEPAIPAAKSIDQGEREALRWAAANLDRRKVFFTNKATYAGSYLGGTIRIDNYDTLGLSGLQGYAWATGGLAEAERALAAERIARQEAFLTAPTPEARARALADIDADYYFHCIRLAPKDFVVPPCLREVHRTDSLVIYQNACRPVLPLEAGAKKE